MIATPLRSLAKAITYRLSGSIITGVIAYVVTRHTQLAVGVGFADVTCKLALYYLHERIWDQIGWGRAFQRSSPAQSDPGHQPLDEEKANPPTPANGTTGLVSLPVALDATRA
jgi:uncharacterized membrane protein